VASLQRDRTGFGVDATELHAVQVRLLEVVPDDLTLPGVPPACVRFEPGGEPRMKSGPELLRKGSICDVSDEHMVEAKGVVALEERAVGSKKFLSCEGEEDAAESLRVLRRQEFRDGAAVEQPPLHRSALKHRALTRLEPVDAGGQERMNRCGQGLVCGLGVVGEHREHLLDEQRIALGCVDDAFAEPRRDVTTVHQPADQILRLVVGQW
jgi:hypothetical protein